MTDGKVWLVGAGPSDPELLTIKAKRLIEEADVIVYDHLIGQSITLLLPERAELLCVGKRAGHHTIPQSEINALLLNKAREGKRVVRLKGGDPFLFGRGGEELELLAANGIPFEVVPGVTSAIAVPAYNGIPVTHRDQNSSLHIITGHRRQGGSPRLDYETLARLSGTLVFLMGVTSLGEICRGLIDAGMNPDTPAAVLQQGTGAGQKRISASLASLPEEVKRQGVETPAIIVVGGVCSYAEEFGWYERLPLFGHRILLTRPRGREGELTDRLTRLGAQVLHVPTIRTETLPDAKTAVAAFVKRPEGFEYLAFTSPTGVEVFLKLLAELRMDLRCLAGSRIAVIGEGTARALERYGLFADLMPEVYDTAHLGRLLGEVCADGASILIPRAKNGSPELLREIRSHRAKQLEITDLPIYDTVYEENARIDPVRECASGRVSMVVFTSRSTVEGFVRLTPGLDYTRVRAVCIGAQTGEAAAQYGMPVTEAREATVDALTEAVLTLAKAQIRR